MVAERAPVGTRPTTTRNVCVNVNANAITNVIGVLGVPSAQRLISDGDVTRFVTEDAPRFEIPCRPDRVYPSDGGVEYEGGTVFRLSPDPEPSGAELEALAEDVLDEERYIYGDWFELPKPVYLVHDEVHSTAFRVVIRYGTVEFHVLPETVPEALRGMYTRLCEASESAWRVECETPRPD
jgi:hypothetical protein